MVALLPGARVLRQFGSDSENLAEAAIVAATTQLLGVRVMEVQALGYVGVGATDLTDWTDFATNWLGMQVVERGNACRAFRMDDRKQRLVVDRSLAEGERYFGFEV